MANSNNDNIQFSKQEFHQLLLQIYKLNRSHLRFIRAISKFSKIIEKEDVFTEVYYESIKEEKQTLLKLLKSQLKKLNDLKSPPFIIASKQQEVDAAKEILGYLDIKTSAVFYEREIQEIQDYLDRFIIELTTNFISSEEYPNNLGNQYFEDGNKWKFDLIKS